MALTLMFDPEAKDIIDAIAADIEHEFYFRAVDGIDHAYVCKMNLADVPKSCCAKTFCVLTMKNGFSVTGESSYSNFANFDYEVGKSAAKQDAVNKVWGGVEYGLRNDLMRNL